MGRQGPGPARIAVHRGEGISEDILVEVLNIIRKRIAQAKTAATSLRRGRRREGDGICRHGAMCDHRVEVQPDLERRRVIQVLTDS